MPAAAGVTSGSCASDEVPSAGRRSARRPVRLGCWLLRPAGALLLDRVPAWPMLRSGAVGSQRAFAQCRLSRYPAAGARTLCGCPVPRFSAVRALPVSRDAGSPSRVRADRDAGHRSAARGRVPLDLPAALGSVRVLATPAAGGPLRRSSCLGREARRGSTGGRTDARHATGAGDVTRLLAWGGICLGSAACAALWWPLGLVPAALVLVMATQLAFGRRRRRGRKV